MLFQKSALSVTPCTWWRPNLYIWDIILYVHHHLGTITLIHIANKAENDCAKNGDRIRRMNKPSESSQKNKKNIDRDIRRRRRWWWRRRRNNSITHADLVQSPRKTTTDIIFLTFKAHNIGILYYCVYAGNNDDLLTLFVGGVGGENCLLYHNSDIHKKLFRFKHHW